jgi:hypothetical protein
MSNPKTIQLRHFCDLFGFEQREVRFVLEQGFVPNGVERSPSTGNRREFAPAGAFWLAIAVLLRRNGLKTPVAAHISDAVTDGVRFITQNLNWDPTFLPLKGWFETDFEYALEIGDGQYMRMVTTGCPSQEGTSYAFDWAVIGRRTQIKGVKPLVILRLDLTEISRVLSRVAGWKCPQR